MLLMFITLLLAVSAVSAEENMTDSDDLQVDEIADTNDTLTANQTTAKTASKITASNVVGYEQFSSKVTVKLTSNGKALSSKKITITINGVNYKKNTDTSGKASVSVKLNKGTYKVSFSYGGDANTTSATGKSTLTIKKATKTSLKIGDKYINYRQGSKTLFYVKLVDSSNKAVKNQIVKFKIRGKTYSAKTDKNGIAKIYLKLKKGNYKVKYSFAKTSPYLSSSGSYKIKVKASMGKGNGYWVWSSHMKNVNLKSLANRGTKQIFLHVHSIATHGKTAVVKWIKRANHYGMKVHLWMQVFYSNGKWVRPVNSDGSFKYGFMNKKIREARSYAKIKGVSGVHFDYVRFGGTAHLYKTSTSAVNYFVKKASIAIHKVRPNCIISAAVMPEPSMMDYYYGQDVSTMSKYIDVVMPMVYKGNYHQKTSWIKSVTQTFVKQSNGAQIWSGLQSYKSDSQPTKLSQSALLKDAKAAMNGGAKGVILFRYGISCNFNF